MINYIKERPYLFHAFAYFIIIISLWFGYQSTKNEQQIRIDQTCKLFEGDHLQDITTLKNTYRYLNALSLEEAQLQINQFIIKTLPSVETEAEQDQAPEYCDESGRGLPEPDPVLPKKQDFSNLLTKKNE